MTREEDGTVNSLGMNDSIERSSCVHMDGTEENCIFAEKDDVTQKFIASIDSQCFHDLWKNSLCFKKSNDNFSIKNDIFMQSQKENGEWCTKRQIDKANEMMMFPSTSNFKNATKMNHIHNCLVTVDYDINAAEEIFGKVFLH